MPKPHSDPFNTQVTPEPALEKRTRRQFKSEYKLRILAAADACKHGDLGALLRREKLYSNQLSAWRREYAQGGIAGLTKSAPGPAPSKTPDQRRIKQLVKEKQSFEPQVGDCQRLSGFAKKSLVDARSFTQWEKMCE